MCLKPHVRPGRHIGSLSGLLPNISGGGNLYVSPGALICELGPIARQASGLTRVEHVGDVVQIYRARFIPFWFNVGAEISDGTTTVRVSTWAFGLRAWVDALSMVGFRPIVHRTWFFLGNYST